MLMDNESFSVQRMAQAAPLYYYRLKPHVKASAAELAALTESLRTICDAKDQKSSVILDCSALRGVDAMKRLLALDLLQTSKSIGQSGILQFVLVTDQSGLRTVAQAIINMRKAADYTRVTASLPEALQFFSVPA